MATKWHHINQWHRTNIIENKEKQKLLHLQKKNKHFHSNRKIDPSWPKVPSESELNTKNLNSFLSTVNSRSCTHVLS